ncbi:MAG: ParD-like family protein [Candidatus Dependentiae bacterium]|nr:ParD-like family protein [Candidatus Dependentiae bacterium]
MATSVKLSDEMVMQAKTMSRALNRSIAGQIEYWAKIGKIVEENPDLTYDFIKKLLIAKEESLAGNVTPYEFDILKIKSYI